MSSPAPYADCDPQALLPLRTYLRSHHRAAAPQTTRLLATAGIVVVLHVVGFGLFAITTVGSGAQVVGFGAVLTAYLAGLKHAFDADHIGAMDNATRKFVGEGRRPTSVGLSFSTGHSMVVIIMCTAVIAGVGTARSLLEGDNPAVSWLAIWGAAVAAAFLLSIGIFNLFSLLTLIKTKRQLSRGIDVDIDVAVNATFLSRLLAAPMRRVRHPRHLFLVGFAFSWGFDTSTTIGLLVLTGVGAASGLSTVSLLALPLCFTAAMALADTVNGLIMLRIYTDATDSGSRRLNFGILVTSLSVSAALFVASAILATMLRETFGLRDPITAFITGIEYDHLGYFMLAVFISLWALTALAGRGRHPHTLDLAS